MKIQNSQFLSALQIQDEYLKQNPKPSEKDLTATESFQDIFRQKTIELQPEHSIGQEDMKFSKHAASRLADRNITLTDDQMERLIDGTKKAERKGINDSLVLVDKLAFIVNVPNNTVITAMDQTETEQNIFTNIDGAVIA